MKHLLWMALVTGALAAQGEAPADPRRAMAQGEEALARSNLVEAADHFARAAEHASVEKLDPAAPHYNRGLALLRDQQAGPAAEAFQRASRTTDLTLQQQALFNRGNALRKLAGDMETAGQQQPALQNIEEALAMYEQAMMLQPSDPDPKVNFELATREKERLEQLIQQQPPSSPQNQEQNQEQNKDQPEKKDDSSAQDQPPQENQQEPSSESQPESNEQPEQNEPQSSGSNQDEETRDQREQESQGAPQDMTKDEATRLLDAMKEQEQANREQVARDRLRMNMGQLPPVEKDW